MNSLPIGCAGPFPCDVGDASRKLRLVVRQINPGRQASTRSIGDFWWIDLEDCFLSQPEGKTNVYWWPGRTVRLNVRPLASPKTASTLIGELQRRGNFEQVHWPEGSAMGLTRYGALLRRGEIAQAPAVALLTFTISARALVQADFLLRQAEDLPWAIEAWRSIRESPQALPATAGARSSRSIVWN